jgi:IclR family transcriptional regulator, acetate operon repressor
VVREPQERLAGMAKNEGSSSVKSATRTLDILELVSGHGRPISAVEVATALNIPISSLSYLLGTLVERGYLSRNGRLYSPGPALARLATPGEAASLADRVGPRVRAISAQLNETAAFFVRHGHEMEAIASEVSAQPLRYNVEVGAPLPLHAFAAGKAILATMSEAELDDYFAHADLAAFTPQTVTDAFSLRAELRAIGQHGLARTAEEYTPGIVGLGRAVIAADSKLVGAISVAIPAARATEALEERAALLLARAAEALGNL